MVVANVGQKELYEPLRKVEQFYSGGAVAVSQRGSLACSCAEEIKADHSDLVPISGRFRNAMPMMYTRPPEALKSHLLKLVLTLLGLV